MKRTDLTDLNNVTNIHMIGIGGISMSGIAIILKRLGFNVTGSDITHGDMIDILINEGIDVFIGTNKENVKNADMVVYTAAISKETNEEYLEAINLCIPTLERAPFLGSLLKQYTSPICVAGMHGKTTTTSMIASILKGINKEPTVLVGAKLKELDNLNYMIGNDDFFVLEACEYVDSFLNFPGKTSVVLNIEEDHLDYFEDLDDIKDSFEQFIDLTYPNGNLVINGDNKNCIDVLNSTQNILTEKNIRLCTFSVEDEHATIFAKDIALNERGAYDFTLVIESKEICKVSLNVPGKHNVMNALASIGTAFVNNIDIISCIPPLEKFTGASRRFEYKKNINNTVRVFDDYAHHPTEIKSTLQTARELNPDRIIAVFEPHTYTRTKALFNEFAESFDNTDIIIITKIYAAREISDGSITSEMLCDAIKQRGVNAIYIESFEDIAKFIKENAKGNDIVLTIGAGTVTKINDLL